MLYQEQSTVLTIQQSRLSYEVRMFNFRKTTELALHSVQRHKWIRKNRGKYIINPYRQAKIPDTQMKGRLYRTWVSFILVFFLHKPSICNSAQLG